MMFNEVIVLGHHISGNGIKVDTSKVEVEKRMERTRKGLG